MVTGLSYLLSVRVRPATLNDPTTPPLLSGAVNPGYEPMEIRFRFTVREHWRR